jgi:hypothetical protein
MSYLEILSCSLLPTVCRLANPGSLFVRASLQHRDIYTVFHGAVFLSRRAAARYWALASIIPGPRLIEKRIYRAAVSQRLRTTAIGY